MLRTALSVLALLALLATTDTIAAQSATDADARIAAMLQRASAAGIPVALLESKIAEGRAKGVDPERIAAAAEARLSGLTRASRALSEVRGVSDAELGLGADALGVGVSDAALREVAAAAPQSRRGVAIAVLAQLVAAGIEPGQAQAQVMQAIHAGGEQLTNLPATARANRGARGRVGPRQPGSDGVNGVRSDGKPGGVPGAGQRPGQDRRRGQGQGGNSP